MAWIELHQTLPTNKKTVRLKNLLRIKTPQAVGHLCILWLWALDNAPDGDLSGFSPEEIAEFSCWQGKNPGDFVGALVQAGFIDSDMMIHDWYEYAGKLLDQRKAQSEYKKRQYALYNDMRLIKAVRARDGNVCQYCGKTVNWDDRRGVNGGTYDHVDPDGGNAIENVVVCCRSCNSKKSGRTPEEAKMPFIYGGYTVKPAEETVEIRQIYGRNTADNSTITVPNPTVPYQTVHNSTVPPNGGTPPIPPASGGRGAGKATAEPQQAHFDEFWAMYPKKVGKEAARKAWNRLKPDKDLRERIAVAVATAQGSQQWNRENGRFVPNPATWLNQGRWDDEYTPATPEPPRMGAAQKPNTLGVLAQIIAEEEGAEHE